MSACAAGLASLGLLPLRSGATDSSGSQAFASMVGGILHLASHTGSSQGNVKLVDVESVGSSPELDQFHLHFRSKPSAQIPEGIYAVTDWSGHPKFDLHVQPSGVDSRGRKLYIASFAQIVEVS